MQSLPVQLITDLAPRRAGLIPLWLVPLVGVGWLGLLALALFPWRRRWPHLAAELGGLGALLLAWLLFFWRPLLSAAYVPQGGGDLNSYYFPLHAFTAGQIAQGHFPFWNPHLHGGMPQLANFQSGMLYPLNLIAYLLADPFRYGTLELLAITHYLIASVGVYALARSLGLGRTAAVASGIVFPYSGFLVAHLGHYSMLSVAAWAPLLLLTTRLMVVRGSWFWAAATGLVVFLMTSAGHQQTLLYALSVAAAWWLFWIAHTYGILGRFPPAVRGGAGTALELEPRIGPTRLLRPVGFDLARAVAALGAGLGMAAPMLLPSLRLANLSVRSGLSLEQAEEFSVEPIALLHLIVPKVFGSNPTDYWGPFSNGEIWSYVGIISLVLAAVALASRPAPVRLFLAGLAIVALLYALGPFTPLQGWSYRFVPFYSLIRAPARMLLYFDLALALLAGYGVATLAAPCDHCARLDGILRRGLRVLLVVLAALILIVIPLLYAAVLGQSDPSNRPMIALDGLNVLVIWLGLTGLLLWGRLRGHLRGSLVALLAIALIVVDLFSATSGFNPTSDDLVAGYRHPQAVAFLQQQWRQQGPFRIESNTAAWQPNLATIAGLDDIGGAFDPMELRDYEAARAAAVADRSLPLYDLLNARYLVTDSKAESPGTKFTRALTTDDGLIVWENQRALDRVWLSYSAVPADLRSAQAGVQRPDFDPRTTLYLTGSLAPAEAGGEGTAKITRYEADAIAMQVETDKPAYLVLADVAYPGWKATVDGRSTPLATADGLFRAVSVPAGSHQVVFSFHPPLVRLSLVPAGLAGALLLAMIVLGIAGRRRRAVPVDSL